MHRDGNEKSPRSRCFLSSYSCSDIKITGQLKAMYINTEQYCRLLTLHHAIRLLCSFTHLQQKLQSVQHCCDKMTDLFRFWEQNQVALFTFYARAGRTGILKKKVLHTPLHPTISVNRKMKRSNRSKPRDILCLSIISLVISESTNLVLVQTALHTSANVLGL